MDIDGVNRREFLGTASAVSGFALTGKVKATRQDVTQLDELLQSDKVSFIRSELSNLSLQPEQATQVDLSAEGDSFFSMTHVPANAGTLSIGKIEGTDYLEVQFKFDQYDPEYRAELERQAEQQGTTTAAHTWPKDTDAFLVGTEDQAVFFRTTSEEEHQSLAEVCGVDSEELISYTHGNLSGYRVVKTSGDDETTDVMDVDATITDIQSAKTVDRDDSADVDNPVQIAEADCDPGLVLANIPLCLAEIDMCASCAALCYAGSFGTGLVGVGACLVCLTHSCGVAALPEVGSCNTIATCAGIIPDWELPDA